MLVNDHDHLRVIIVGQEGVFKGIEDETNVYWDQDSLYGSSERTPS
jgi:hypothetical protein